MDSLKKFSLGIAKKNQLCYAKTENQVQVNWQVNIQLQQNSELYMKEKERCLEVCFLSIYGTPYEWGRWCNTVLGRIPLKYQPSLCKFTCNFINCSIGITLHTGQHWICFMALVITFLIVLKWKVFIDLSCCNIKCLPKYLFHKVITMKDEVVGVIS